MSGSILFETERHVRSLLETSLDKRLYYHNTLHTVNVVDHASYLANTEGLSGEETEIVLIAEWFHDTGFIASYIGHEQESVRIANHFLSPLLPEQRIKKITACILATKKGTPPQDVLQAIMHDADYYHFFQPDYFQLVNDLRKEVAEVLGKTFTHQQWYEMNAKFLSQQSFYTAACKERWPKQKEFLLTENNRIVQESV